MKFAARYQLLLMSDRDTHVTSDILATLAAKYALLASGGVCRGAIPDAAATGLPAVGVRAVSVAGRGGGCTGAGRVRLGLRRLGGARSASGRALVAAPDGRRTGVPDVDARV